MSKYVVLTDSTCDLPEEAAKQHNIDIVCFKIALDGEGYTERVDFTPEQFCEMLKKASGLPTTAQITQFEFFDKFEEYDRQGVEQTLYISINAGGSGIRAKSRDAHLGQSIHHAKGKGIVLCNNNIIKGFCLGKGDHGVYIRCRDVFAGGIVTNAAVARGTPDIAAVGAFFQRADNGVFTPAAANNQNFHGKLLSLK